VFLGDLVSKGPSSAKVVKLAMKINASCVIGNHDFELLEWMGYVNAHEDFRADAMNSGHAAKEHVLGSKTLKSAAGFERQAAEWLVQCPYILKAGKVNGEELLAVHGGLVPGVTLEEQRTAPMSRNLILEPWSIMNMRNMYKGKPSKDTDEGDPWAELWNKSQRRSKHPTTVIYGHDARRVCTSLTAFNP
jgi:Calcineurin-like phosphoesterase